MTLVNRRRFITISAIAAAGTMLPSAISAAVQKKQMHRWRGVVLGADATIQLYHPNKKTAKKLTNKALQEIIRLEKLFSLYEPASMISKLNKDGKVQDIHGEFISLVNEANSYSELTDGAFDITVQPLWDFYKKHFATDDSEGPSNEDLEKVVSLIGYKDISVEEDEVFFRKKGMAITLNGIAQGYITDKVTEMLWDNGVKNVLVELGETRALGKHPDGYAWNVGIKDPEDGDNVIDRVILSNQAVATSGGYGTTFDKEGKYHHLFDPKTGKSGSSYKSVSVVAPNATMADALSTSFSLLPREKALELARKLPNITAIFVDNGGEVTRV